MSLPQCLICSKEMSLPNAGTRKPILLHCSSCNVTISLTEWLDAALAPAYETIEKEKKDSIFTGEVGKTEGFRFYEPPPWNWKRELRHCWLMWPLRGAKRRAKAFWQWLRQNQQPAESYDKK